MLVVWTDLWFIEREASSMAIVAKLRTKTWTYEIEDDFGRWVFVRSNGKRFEDFPLDHDKRHARFFLSEKDQRRVGLDGLTALEKLARKVLDR